MATRHLQFYRSGVDPEHYHHAPDRAFWGTAIVLAGVPGYLYWKRGKRKSRESM